MFDDCEMKKYIVYLAFFLGCIACETTKYVPEGSYLLDKVNINSDVKSIGNSQLKPYLRQKPNSSLPVLGKVRLHIYSIPDNDSTWLNRQLHKFGEPPVLYSPQLTEVSAEQMRQYLHNKGYLRARVDTSLVKKEKKALVSYQITGNDAYHVRNFRDTIQSADTTIYSILSESRRLQVMKEKDIFDLEVLEEGRVKLADELRNRGYYNFNQENFYYLADTTVGNREVDLTLGMNNPTDSTLHKRYTIGNVTVINGIDPVILQDSSRHHALDTIEYRGMRVVSEKEKFLLPQAIYYNNFVRPGRLYSDRLVERTYSSLSQLGSVNQTSINFTPVVRNDSNFLDANILLVPGNLHYMQFGVDGTHSAGDLGVATNLTYEHRNLFKGGERLRLRLNGAYEFISATDSTDLLDHSFYEYGAEAFLSIPQLLLPWLMKRLKDRPSASTEFSIGANFQNRPEYLRQFFNLSTRLQWSALNWQVTHEVNPVDITYIRMPRTSQRFRDLYLNDDANPILRYSYEEQLIVRTAYSISYTNASFRHTPLIPFRLRVGGEVAGWIPRIVTSLNKSKTNDEGYKKILGTRYAEYVKGDIDFAPVYRLNENSTLAAHIAVGVAYPYGNSVVLPFEKRYYGGGANSVRGWSTRTLGPGIYGSDTLRYDFANRTGDIRLDMSVEYRRKLTKMFELAGFIDAGNIWTIKDYSGQPGGYFQFSEFYKQLAIAYGAGVRLDLNFLLLRFDFGMKAHNPAMPENQRWTIFKPKMRRDFAFHFAIGYPF